MVFTEQDGERLTAQVNQLMTQMTTMMAQNDVVSGAFDTFKAQATAEINTLRAQGAMSAGAAGGAGGNKLEVKLVDLKDFKPTVFSGTRDQDFKPWRKRFLTYANLQVPGFRAALEWVEKRETEITDATISELGWVRSGEASPALWDFLSLMTSEDALAIVEKVKTRGFEAWRLIHKRFSPSGGRHELKKMLAVFKRTPCKSLKDIPRALDDLEKDISSYNRSTGFTFP